MAFGNLAGPNSALDGSKSRTWDTGCDGLGARALVLIPGQQEVSMDDKALYCEIKKQHETLKEEVHRLRVAARSRPDYMSDEHWRGLALGEARRLRDCLRAHFKLEEVGGYLDPVMEKRPGLGRAVRKLHEQHAQILLELERVDDACRMEAPIDEIERLALRALDLLQKHEFAESDLIQEAIGSDLGVCD